MEVIRDPLWHTNYTFLLKDHMYQHGPNFLNPLLTIVTLSYECNIFELDLRTIDN